MLSIIIPTLNEEKSLPVLLESIKKQRFAGCAGIEIIVADFNSKDKTVEIARSYGCKIAEGGKPAEGRNNGAMLAKGNLLLFLDADAILPGDFLRNALGEFERRRLDVAGFRLEPEGKKFFEVLLMNILYNWTLLLALEKILPHASGQAILVKKEKHQKVGGFDKEIRIGEDHMYVRSVDKIGRFGAIRSTKVISSVRRYKEDGLIRTNLKYALAEVYMALVREGVKKDFFKYKFDH